MEILVFKTNITSKKKVSKAGLLLTSIPTIEQWNFDLDDCDKVLRIIATGIKPSLIESLLQSGGFNCQVLDY